MHLLKFLFLSLLLVAISSCVSSTGVLIRPGESPVRAQASSALSFPFPGVRISSNIPYQGTVVSVTNGSRETPVYLDMLVGPYHYAGLKPGEQWIFPALGDWSTRGATYAVVIQGRYPDTNQPAGVWTSTVNVNGYYHHEVPIIIRDGTLK